MPETDEAGSWLESRRLIISQLSSMDGSIKELSTKIDRFNEAAREKAIDVAKEAQTGITELNLRVAMLEMKAKMWGAAIGLVAGGVGTIAIDIIKRAFDH